jgi:membrane-associated phospholipid phosphatase
MEGFFSNPVLFGEGFLNAVHLFLGAWFDLFMSVITWLGDEAFYTLSLPILYWCYHKKNTIKIGVVFLLSAAINDMAKEFFQNPRPDPRALAEGVRELALKHAPKSYGFPSGHTQCTVSYFGTLFYLTKNTPVKILSIALILLIPYSRMYLGVHYLGDVIGGYLIGCLTLFLFIPPLLLADKKEININESLVAALLLVIPFVIYTLVPGNAVNKIMGVLSGFLIGVLYAEKRIDFDPRASFVAGVLKVLIGLTIVFAIRTGLKAMLPDIPMADFFRYWVMGFWITFGAPLIFSRIKLLKGGRS